MKIRQAKKIKSKVERGICFRYSYSQYETACRVISRKLRNVKLEPVTTAYCNPKFTISFKDIDTGDEIFSKVLTQGQMRDFQKRAYERLERQFLSNIAPESSGRFTSDLYDPLEVAKDIEWLKGSISMKPIFHHEQAFRPTIDRFLLTTS